jgi:hypothetical protein
MAIDNFQVYVYALHNMAVDSLKEKKKPGPKPEFPGLTADAATLGISRYFLWKVLKGYAVSKPTLARYRELKSTK